MFERIATIILALAFNHNRVVTVFANGAVPLFTPFAREQVLLSRVAKHFVATNAWVNSTQLKQS